VGSPRRETVIEESIRIDAGVRDVWETFTDFACWDKWCTAVGGLQAEGRAAPGSGPALRFSIRPFSLPITITPAIDEMVPLEKIAWRGRKYGVAARHEFAFAEDGGGTLLTSREVFSGPAMRFLSFLVPLGRLHGITVRLLEDIKRESERLAEEGS
jgi:hypothetical protein